MRGRLSIGLGARYPPQCLSCEEVHRWLEPKKEEAPSSEGNLRFEPRPRGPSGLAASESRPCWWRISSACTRTKSEYRTLNRKERQTSLSSMATTEQERQRSFACCFTCSEKRTTGGIEPIWEGFPFAGSR